MTTLDPKSQELKSQYAEWRERTQRERQAKERQQNWEDLRGMAGFIIALAIGCALLLVTMTGLLSLASLLWRALS